jgi:hypothetical protein
MIRRVTFTNTGSGTLSLEVLDGLAQLYPFGPSLDQVRCVRNARHLFLHETLTYGSSF